jgi:NAD(P)-dependent dehydrogenase (short-subunit alcohol dehydrogenase family)
MAEVAHELEAYKIPVATFGCNVTDPDDVAQAFSGAVEQFGQIDYIFNNTGYQGVFAKTDEYPEEDFQKVIDQEIGIQAPSSVDGFSWFLIYSFKTSKGAPPTETAK